MAPLAPRACAVDRNFAACRVQTRTRAGLARLWLTPWAVERRPVHELLPPHHRAAAPARLAFASVGVQRSLEIPGFAVDIDIERVERRTAVAQRVGHHLRRRIQQLAELLAAQR